MREQAPEVLPPQCPHAALAGDVGGDGMPHAGDESAYPDTVPGLVAAGQAVAGPPHRNAAILENEEAIGGVALPEKDLTRLIPPVDQVQ